MEHLQWIVHAILSQTDFVKQNARNSVWPTILLSPFENLNNSFRSTRLSSLEWEQLQLTQSPEILLRRCPPSQIGN